MSSQNLAASKIEVNTIGFQLKDKSWTPPFFYENKNGIFLQLIFQ